MADRVASHHELIEEMRGHAERCKTCGVETPPYDFYRDLHRDNDSRDGQNSFLDRFVYKILGRGT